MFQFANLFEITAFLNYDFVTKHSPCLFKATLLVIQDLDIFYFAIPELVFMMLIVPKLKLFTYSNLISNLNIYLPKILTVFLTQKFCVSVLGLVKINHLLMVLKIQCDYENFLYSFYNFFY
jgi:hypothetical protein